MLAEMHPDNICRTEIGCLRVFVFMLIPSEPPNPRGNHAASRYDSGLMLQPWWIPRSCSIVRGKFPLLLLRQGCGYAPMRHEPKNVLHYIPLFQ